MPWRLLKYATAAFGALVALLFGGWTLLCKQTDDATIDAFWHLTDDSLAHP